MRRRIAKPAFSPAALIALALAGQSLFGQTITAVNPHRAQTAAAGQALPESFRVNLTDALGSPLAGQQVTFTAPASGPSGTFSGGSTVAIVTTDTSGNATAPVFTSGSIVGPTSSFYEITASAGTASAKLYAANCVAGPLVVTSAADAGTGTLRDAVGNACSGALITFALPSPATIFLTSGPISDLRLPPTTLDFIPLVNTVSILGPGQNTLTIDGGSLIRPFILNGGTQTRPMFIANLTIANGRGNGGNGNTGGGGAAGVGGALLNRGFLTVANVRFQGNSAIGGKGSARITSGAGGGGGGMGGDGLPWRPNNIGGFGGNGGPGAVYGMYDLGGAGGLETPPSAGGAATFSGGGGGGSVGFAGGNGALFGGGGGAGYGNLSPATGGNGGPYGGGGGGGSPSVPGLYGGAGAADLISGYGGGGAGLGGAVVNLGVLHLANVTFISNTATAGSSAGQGAQNGQAKGGAVASFNGSYLSSYGSPTFQGNTAGDAGQGTACPGADTPDVCGSVNIAPLVGISAPAGPDQLVVLTGSPQTTPPGGSFSVPITVKLLNNSDPNLVTGRANYPVTFTLPASGASGTFAGGLTTITLPTDDSGVTTVPAITTNATAGAFVITASIGDVSVPITVSNGLPAGTTITATGGTPQQAAAGQQFSNLLQVVVKDASNRPLPGASVVFTAPAAGVSGTFVGGAALVTAITDTNGLATAPAFRANYFLGSYTVTASAGNITVPLNLTNLLPSGSTLTAASGNGQNVPVGNGYSPLQVVLRDSSGHGIQGVSITVTAPGTGASLLFANNATTQTLTTDAAGSATTTTPTANYIVGAFAVNAVYSTLSASFSETNTVPAASVFTITGGNGQSTNPGTPFAQPLQVTLLDAGGHGIAGASVQFSISGGTGTSFTGGATTATVVTNATGVANSPALLAGTSLGSFTVSAISPGYSVTFNLSAFSAAGSVLDVEVGSPQTTPVGRNFGSALIVRLHTQFGVSIPGIPVTFTAPATGPSGTFAVQTGASNTVTITTDAGGRAVSPTFKANLTGGSYAVTASVSSLTANFSLTNFGPSSIVPLPNHPLTVVANTLFPFAIQLLQSDGTPFQEPGTCKINSTDPNCFVVRFSDNLGPLSPDYYPTDGNGILRGSLSTNSTASKTITATIRNGASTQIQVNFVGGGNFLPGFVPPVVTIAPGSGGSPIRIPVVDGNSNPVLNASVTFSLPSSSPLSFSGLSSITVLTDADGYALSPPITVKVGATVTADQLTGTASTGGQTLNLPIQVLAASSVPATITLKAVDTLFSTKSASTFKITLTPSSASGQVVLFDNGNPAKTLTLPASTFTYRFRAVGTHPLTLEYFGDASNGPSFSAPLVVFANDTNYSQLFSTVVVETTNDGNGSSSECQVSTTTGFGLIYNGKQCTTDGSQGSKMLARSLAVSEAAPAITAAAASSASTSTPPVLTPYTTGPGPHALVFGDFDGDGIADVLETNQGNSTISFLKSTGTSLNNPITFSSPSVPGPITTGDFNHDGLLDFAYGTSDGSVVVGINTGNATFVFLSPLTAGSSVAAILAPDLNGDGFVDLVVTDGATGQIRTFLNNKNGLLNPVTSTSQAGAQPRAMLTADFNKDGIPDVAVAYYAESASDTSGQGTIAILLGKGDGTFQSPKFLPGARPVSLAIGQFAGHTAVDLVVASANSSNISVYYGNGDGTFAAPILKSTGANPSAVLVGDFDGDGRADIQVISSSASTINYLFGAPPAAVITPTIQWPKPADITAGTPLSATQLNAVAVNASGLPIPGTFVYTPAAGVVLPAGNNQALSVQFTPTDTASYAPITGSQTINVTPTYSAAIVITLAPTQITYPLGVNVKVCITRATSATPTGSVQVLDGATPLKTLALGGDGCAYWYISPGLDVGTHALQSSYSGDSKNPSGISAPATLTVTPAPTFMSLSCWNAVFPYGADYQCTLNVSSTAGTPLGSISYSYDGGTPITIALSGGNAQFKVAKPVVGSHSVKVAYTPTANYGAVAAQTQSFTVSLAPVIVALQPSSYYFKKGTALTLQAAVSSWSAGAPNATGKISFYDGTTLLATVAVDASGKASCVNTTLAAGLHTIKATYSGGANYDTGSGVAVITVTP